MEWTMGKSNPCEKKIRNYNTNSISYNICNALFRGRSQSGDWERDGKQDCMDDVPNQEIVNERNQEIVNERKIIIPIVFLIIFVILYLEDVPDQEIGNERKKSEMAKFIVH